MINETTSCPESTQTFHATSTGSGLRQTREATFQAGRPVPRYAVVFKTYTWDPFVYKQAVRCAEVTGSGDFFISADESNGPLGPIPFQRVLRLCNDELIGMGLPDRFERGCLLWWNPDYAHYHFRKLYPDYDYYLFVEYDAVVQGAPGSLDILMERIADAKADLVALPIREAKTDWCWTAPHRRVYSLEKIEGALICVSVQSRRALDLLAERRRELSRTGTTYWPSAEVFLPTEIQSAGYRYRSLEEFGDVQRFDWFPPLLDRELPRSAEPGFLHPVLDDRRYIRWLLEENFTIQRMLHPGSQLYRVLAPFRKRDYIPALWRELRKSSWSSLFE